MSLDFFLDLALELRVPKLHRVPLLKCCALFSRNSRLIAQKPLSWTKFYNIPP